MRANWQPPGAPPRDVGGRTLTKARQPKGVEKSDRNREHEPPDHEPPDLERERLDREQREAWERDRPCREQQAHRHFQGFKQAQLDRQRKARSNRASVMRAYVAANPDLARIIKGR
jgi:hypothetical protein